VLHLAECLDWPTSIPLVERGAQRPGSEGVPGRPRRRRERGTAHARAAILRAVEDLIAGRRLDELTVGQIVDAAGVSRASFYIHFESKAAVVAALVESVIDEIYAEWERWFDGEEPSDRATLQLHIGGTMSLWREHAALMSAMVESWHTDPEIYDLWGGMLHRFTTGAAERIERDRQAGRLPVDGLDPRVLAAALVWLNERCYYVAMSGAEPAFAGGEETLVPTLVAIWMRALGV
jgi:AcrR family transcriptional regulator